MPVFLARFFRPILVRARPHCFSKVETSETISINKDQKIIKAEKLGSINNCPKYFGYLANNYTKSIISIECLSCEKMTECVKDSN